jgi:hypothetical protein
MADNVIVVEGAEGEVFAFLPHALWSEKLHDWLKNTELSIETVHSDDPNVVITRMVARRKVVRS